MPRIPKEEAPGGMVYATVAARKKGTGTGTMPAYKDPEEPDQFFPEYVDLFNAAKTALGESGSLDPAKRISAYENACQILATAGMIFETCEPGSGKKYEKQCAEGLRFLRHIMDDERTLAENTRKIKELSAYGEKYQQPHIDKATRITRDIEITRKLLYKIFDAVQVV